MNKLHFFYAVLLVLIASVCTNGNTSKPTKAPTFKPTRAPTQPTPSPTRAPTAPTRIPSEKPTRKPTAAPSGPTRRPTIKPTRAPTYRAKASSIYTDHAPTKTLTVDEQQGIVAALTILLFILMATEITTPEVLFLIALCLLILLEVLTLAQGLSGFSNAALVTIGSLFLVIGAVEKSHVVDWLARQTFGVRGSAFIGKLRMYCTCFALSTFFNNTPLVAILMPVVKDWGRMRGIAASQLLIPLSYAVLSGSFGSMIGTSSNLTIQGLMEVDRNYTFSFFAPFPIGIVCFVVLTIYMLIAGPYLLPTDKSGLIRQARDSTKSLIAEVLVSRDSHSVGKTVEYFASSLGVSPTSVIKIRRCVRQSANDVEEGHVQTAASILDYQYLRKAASFWTSSKVSDTESDVDKREHNVHSDADYIDIIAPPPHELVGANDVVFLSSAQDAINKMMKSIMGESRGLKILQADVLALPGFGSEVLECVVSDKNPFIGKKVSEMSKEFAEKYQAGLITVRGREWGNIFSNPETTKDENTKQPKGHLPLRSNEDQQDLVEDFSPKDAVFEMTDIYQQSPEPPEPVSPVASEKGDSKVLLTTSPTTIVDVPTVSDHMIGLGDVILCVTNQKQVSKLSQHPDFFVVSPVGSLPKPLTFYGMFPVLCFLTMLVLVATECIDICPASMVFSAFLFMGGWLKPEEIPRLVDLRLLMLLGCSLSFANSMTTSGLGARIAQQISHADPTPFSALLLIYAITLVITELISNNAAGALMYPIAVGLADELGVSFKPFAMCVLIACTAGFMCPTGYQTHVMVWGPGGYNFKDFVVFGLVPDLIYWLIGCALIAVTFPF